MSILVRVYTKLEYDLTMSQYINQNPQYDPLQVDNENYELFDLDVDDAKLKALLIHSLEKNVDHWNRKPWELQETDEKNIEYYLGNQIDQRFLLPHNTKYIDPRLFTSMRAILSYVTGQLAKPEILPSKSDDKSKRLARDIENALYQHGLNMHTGSRARAATMNVLYRKRGFLKLRWDANYGANGDIVVDNIDPADIVVDRFARPHEDPNIIYHKQRCTVEELIAKFPDKETEILQALSIKQGRQSQMTRMVTYYECWFSYWDSDNKKCQGLAWFLGGTEVILGKMKNPNWIYKGSEKQQKIVNVTSEPIKPFVIFSYINTGRSLIDETSLFDMARPMQDVLNKRGRQIMENADYANGRFVASKKTFSEDDASKFVNKNPKTVALINSEDIGKSIQQYPAAQLPSYVVDTLLDARNEIDTVMGTPTQFRGEAPNKNAPTLGQDMLVKQQAGQLQDDLVEVVNGAMQHYYTYTLQMMKVYYTDDYWFQAKGEDGQYDFVMLNDDRIDSNVKITIQTDSTLPLDKPSIRATALELAKMGRIDDLTLFEDLGLPDAQKRAERLQRFKIDLYTYMQSLEQGLYNAEAETDITLIVAGKKPEERDDYSEDYLNYFNHFVTTNRFTLLPQDQKVRIMAFLQGTKSKAERTAQLGTAMLGPAGIIDRPPIFPLPRRTMNIRLMGQMSPQQTQQIAGGEAQLAIPVNQAQQAQQQAANGQTGQVAPGGPVSGSTPPGAGAPPGIQT